LDSIIKEGIETVVETTKEEYKKSFKEKVLELFESVNNNEDLKEKVGTTLKNIKAKAILSDFVLEWDDDNFSYKEENGIPIEMTYSLKDSMELTYTLFMFNEFGSGSLLLPATRKWALLKEKI